MAEQQWHRTRPLLAGFRHLNGQSRGSETVTVNVNPFVEARDRAERMIADRDRTIQELLAEVARLRALVLTASLSLSDGARPQQQQQPSDLIRGSV